MAKKILCIGDAMIDKHLYGACHRISPECPVPVVDLEPTNVVTSLGAAANVASHIVNAGIECVLAYKSFVDPPKNNSHEILMSMCIENGIACLPLEFDNVQHTVTIKERVWAGNQQVCRIDRENRDKPNKEVETLWIKKIIKAIECYDIGTVIFSDYDKGTLTDSIILNVAGYCRDNGIPTILDPKRPTFYKIKRLSIIKPNAREIKATNHPPSFLSDELGDTYLVNTLGKEGMVAYRYGEKEFEFPTLAHPNEIKDVTGCGDTVCAILGIALYFGVDIETSIKAASAGAALTIQYKGCYVPPKKEMKKIIEDYGLCK